MKKVYVNTVDEFVKALDEGKVINDSKYYGKIYRKGTAVIADCKDGTNTLYPYVNFEEKVKNRFFYENEEPFGIEVGKFYQTDSGKKVFIFCYQKYNNKYLGVVIGDIQYQAAYRFNKDGSQTHSYLNLTLKKEIKPEEV